MMRWKGLQAAALATVAVLGAAPGAVVLAQDGNSTEVFDDTLGVTVVAPEGWEKVRVSGNDKSVANFRHGASQSQIEVIGTKLFNKDVGQQFLDTFYDNMLANAFTEARPAKDLKVGPLEGKLTQYAFEHTGIQLSVVVYGFVRDEQAYLVIGYFKSEELETYYPALQKVIETLRFSS